MHKLFIVLIPVLIILSCEKSTDGHQEPTHNFTVKRLIVLNDDGEILMGEEDANWYTLAHVYNKSQYVKECLDSVSNDYGIKTSTPQLHGYFSYKYEYHPYSTLRAFYVAKYISGDPKPAGAVVKMKWMPIEEAIAKTPVESMKLATQQILTYPDTLWGGSFMIYRKGEEHHARLVEDFYPLFN